MRTRTYTEKDGDGVSKLPGWKAFIEAARDWPFFQQYQPDTNSPAGKQVQDVLDVLLQCNLATSVRSPLANASAAVSAAPAAVDEARMCSMFVLISRSNICE